MNYYLFILAFLLLPIWGVWQHLDRRQSSRSQIGRWGIIAASTAFLTIGLNHLTSPLVSLIFAGIASCSISILNLWSTKLHLPRTKRQQEIWSIVSLVSLLAAIALWLVPGPPELVKLGLTAILFSIAVLGLMTSWIKLRAGVITGIVTASLIASFQLQGTFTPAALAAEETFAAGAYIIDLGQLTQTVANGLKPYGLVYDLVINKGIPVKWAINPTKAKDGVDFTANSKVYKGSAFIISPEYATSATTTINAWKAKGVVVDGGSAAFPGFTAPIFDTITSFPNAVLDQKNGSIAADYFTNAEIPITSASTGIFGTFTTYRIGLPSSLTSCDDVYVMPHADPTWTDHKKLLPFNQSKGYIWAACHAVSVLENIDGTTDSTLPFTNTNGTAPDLNFLSGANGLVPFGSHADGSLPYTYSPLGSASPYQWLAANDVDPIMQFMGTLDAATQNGSEQIYLPKSTGWRSTTKISVHDPSQADVPSQSPGSAAVVAYGRGFGNATNGMVMYEGGHSHAKASDADNVAAQRAFFNFILLAGIERRPPMTTNIPSPIIGGTTVNVSATGGTTYKWVSDCAGTFANSTAASTTFTAPSVSANTTCNIKVAITDGCSRRNFDSKSSIIVPPVTISGSVFEDVNYGGGAGRSLSGASGVGRGGAKVELYDSTGTLRQTTTTSSVTATLGQYSFSVALGDYTVRVVNSTVTSSRTGYISGLSPVQTFRTDAGTTAGTVTPVTDRVGGEKPAEVDATAGTVNTTTLTTLNTGNTEAQSVTAVKVGSSSVTGINFGFNFDTIVNTNNTGQGSLRQFVANSNALSNTGLDQVANPNPAPGTTAIDPVAGVETSIFMISASSLPSNGVAVINLGSGGRLTITNAFTAIDGRTQTINQGNTNNTILGDTSTIIGVNGSTLTGVNGPEIELKIINDVAIYTNGANTYFNGIAINGSGVAAIQTTSSASNSRVENMVIGTTTAAQSQPGGGLGAALQLNGSNTVVDRNLILSTIEPIVVNSLNVSGLTVVKITNNEITTGNLTGDPATSACIRLGNANSKSAANTLIQGNYLHKCAWGMLLNGDTTGFNTTILKNTVDNSSSIGILINSGEHDHTIQENIIRNSSGAGIVVEQGVTGIKVTQNSIYSNGNVGIDLSLYPGFYSTQGLTPNNGIKDDASSTDQFGNNGMDYPVITYATLTSGNLKVKGFVGSSLTNSTFSGANLEFFIADNSPVNQNGEVILGDFKSKPHGEGRTYLGSCLADANSQFNCSFPTAGALGLSNPNDITATATDSTGNTSEFSAGPAEKANLIIVKRITAIKDGITGGITTFADFVDDPTPQDQNLGWTHTNAAGSYLLGEIDGGKIKPGDEVEYTMYYLNSGENRITQARVCDRLNADLVFQRQFSTATTNVQGIQVVKGSDTNYLTNTNIDTDGGFFSESSTMPTGCNTAANSTINLSDNVVVADVASNSNPLLGGERGYIKFKVKIRE